jgi:cell wall-associated NlpC family hydrolase
VARPFPFGFGALEEVTIVNSGTRSTTVQAGPRAVTGAARRNGVRTALRITGTAVAVAVAVGLTPAVAGAAPRGPSDSQIAAAQAAADAVAARIGDLSGRLTAAQADVDAAHASSALALDEFQARQTAYEDAQQRADVAAAAAARATADLGVARGDIIAFARRSYMQGSTYSGAAALITAADPGELIQRAALLEAAGTHRSDVLDRVTVLQEQATATETVARTTLTEAATLQEQATAALAVAQTAEISAREQAAALGTQQAQLQTELAAAQQELTGLIGERAAAERTAQVVAPAPKPATPPAPSGNTTRAGSGSASAAQTAIDVAMGYRGLPYAWGGGGTRGPGPGMDPDEGIVGFDCSGLTQYAYAQAGISIPRNSRSQYSALPKVSSNDLQAGDLVFWGSDPSDPDSITHVALYLGGGKVVQAPQSGDVVKVSDMWWRSYVGAVRPSA